LKYFDEQTNSMDKNYKELATLENTLNSTGFQTSDPDFKTQIFKLDLISKEQEKIISNSKDFDSSLESLINGKLNYEIATLVIICVLTLVSYVCNIKLIFSL
jgi:hypothetical protein